MISSWLQRSQSIMLGRVWQSQVTRITVARKQTDWQVFFFSLNLGPYLGDGFANI